ncbi:MAG: hypothetical protein AAF519_17210 [Bacteroidota bacterium]
MRYCLFILFIPAFALAQAQPTVFRPEFRITLKTVSANELNEDSLASPKLLEMLEREGKTVDDVRNELTKKGKRRDRSEVYHFSPGESFYIVESEDGYTVQDFRLGAEWFLNKSQKTASVYYANVELTLADKEPEIFGEPLNWEQQVDEEKSGDFDARKFKAVKTTEYRKRKIKTIYTTWITEELKIPKLALSRSFPGPLPEDEGIPVRSESLRYSDLLISRTITEFTNLESSDLELDLSDWVFEAEELDEEVFEGSSSIIIDGVEYPMDDGEPKWEVFSEPKYFFDYVSATTFKLDNENAIVNLSGNQMFLPLFGLTPSGYRSKGITHFWLTSTSDRPNNEYFLRLEQAGDYALRLQSIDRQEKDKVFMNFEEYEGVDPDGDMLSKGRRYYSNDSGWPIGCYRYVLNHKDQLLLIDYFEVLGTGEFQRVDEWVNKLIEFN